MKKEELYTQLHQQLDALLDNEHDQIANLANASALLFMNLQDINWAGFYIYKHDELVLGPFQGKVACMHIPIGKGVCGTCFAKKCVQRIANVHEFAGHIACDIQSNSEIVIPIYKDSECIGVLDIDSQLLNRFDEEDEKGLCSFVRVLEQHLS